MKLFTTRTARLLGQSNHETVSLSNAADEAPAFHITQKDSFFVPYGTFPHPLGLQIFNRAAAEEMQRQFESFTGAIRRVAQSRSMSAFSLGAPIYIGHPDDPLKAAKWPDKKSYGWVTAVVPMENGVEFPIKWSAPGRELIEQGHFVFYSPFWDSIPVKDGRAPFRLRSIGLTNQPNIPVPPLSNDANFEAAHLSTPVSAPASPSTDHPTSDHEPKMKLHPELAKLLGLKEESNDAEISGAVEQMNQRIAKHNEPDGDETPFTHAGMAETLGLSNGATFGDAHAALKKLKPEPAKEEKGEKEEKPDASQSNDLDNRLAQAEAAAASAKRSRVASAVDTAVAQGRVKIADHESTVTRILSLSNDAEVTTEIHRILTASPALRTKSQTEDLAGKKDKIIAQSNEKSAERDALVNEEMAKLPKTTPENRKFELAWQAARSRKPSLFR